MTTTPAGGAPDKDPDTWVTGDEPATSSQLSYLETLATDSGQDVPTEINKADASKLIDELQDKSPRLSGDEPS